MWAGGPRSRKTGCLRGCLNLAGIAFILMIALAIVSRFVPIPLLVYVNPVPYFFQYSRIVSAGSEETVQIWDATNGHTLYVLSGGDRSF